MGLKLPKTDWSLLKMIFRTTDLRGFFRGGVECGGFWSKVEVGHRPGACALLRPVTIFLISRDCQYFGHEIWFSYVYLLSVTNCVHF